MSLVDAGDGLPGPRAPTGTVTAGARRYAINWWPGEDATHNDETPSIPSPTARWASGATSSFTLNVGSADPPHTRIVQVGDTGSWQVCISRGALTAQPNRACATVEVFDFPTADAGADQTVETGATVTLMGGGTPGISGASLSYAWTRTGGTEVSLSSAAAQNPTFTAPSFKDDLEFSLVVNDGSNDSV